MGHSSFATRCTGSPTNPRMGNASGKDVKTWHPQPRGPGVSRWRYSRLGRSLWLCADHTITMKLWSWQTQIPEGDRFCGLDVISVLSKIPLRCWRVQLPRDLQRARKKECLTALKDCRKDSNHGVIFAGMARIVFLTMIELIIIMVYGCFWRFGTFWGVCIPARHSRLRRNPRKRP